MAKLNHTRKDENGAIYKKVDLGGKIHIGMVFNDDVHVKCGRINKLSPKSTITTAEITCKKCKAKWDKMNKVETESKKVETESKKVVKLTNVELTTNEIALIKCHLGLNGSKTFNGLKDDNYSCVSYSDYVEQTGFSKNRISGIIGSLKSKGVIYEEERIKEGDTTLYWISEKFINTLTEDEANKNFDELFTPTASKKISTEFKLGLLVDKDGNPLRNSKGKFIYSTSEASEKALTTMYGSTNILHFTKKGTFEINSDTNVKDLETKFNDKLFVICNKDGEPIARIKVKKSKNRTIKKKNYMIYDNETSVYRALKQLKSKDVTICQYEIEQ